jgi:hypothetical protein
MLSFSIRGFLIMLLIWICATTSYAQFSDTVHYYLNYASTGTINKVNEGTSYILNNSLRFSVSKKEYSLNTTNTWIYGKQLSTLSNNDVYSGLDFSWYKTIPHFYYWGLASYEKSYSLKINHRVQSGAGVGYNIVDRQGVLVIVSDGLLYEKSGLYNLPEVGTQTYEVVRNSLRLKFRFIIRKIVTLEGSHFVQHALDDRHDYIIKSNTTMSIRLTRGVSLTTSAVYNKLSTTRRENLLVTYGILFERYF